MSAIDLNHKPWLPSAFEINVRCESFYIAETQRVCWHCHRTTRVFAYVLPKGHEAIDELTDGRIFQSDDEYERWSDSPESMGWLPQATDSVLYYVRHLPQCVQTCMMGLTQRYRMVYSKTIGSFYFMNHCEYCDNKQSDFELIEEFDAPLRPIHADHAARVTLRPFREAIQALGATLPLEDQILRGMKLLTVPPIC